MFNVLCDDCTGLTQLHVPADGSTDKSLPFALNVVFSRLHSKTVIKSRYVQLISEHRPA